jgi:Sulfotransferase family
MPRIEDIDRFAFVVGAPRCGTTSLANFLKPHPGVCFPILKEPHYFAQHDLRALDDTELKSKVEKEYLARFFPHSGGDARLAADCSVSYLYAPEQLEPAIQLWPKSRFIVILRDPMEMIPSLHQRLVSLGDETLTNFEDAWAAVPDRAQGRRIPPSCVEPRWLRYDQAGRYATYLEQLFASVARERCLVLLFDDLAADPAGQYRSLMDFLDLPALEETVNFAPRRQSYGVRFNWLQRLLKRPPKPLWKYLSGPFQQKRERKLDGKESDRPVVDTIFAVRKRLLHWNRIPLKKQPPPLWVQEEIRSQLKDEIERVGKLIGRDLGHWLEILPQEAMSSIRSTGTDAKPSFTPAEMKRSTG